MDEKETRLEKAREEYPHLTENHKYPKRTKEEIIKIAREYFEKGAMKLATEMNMNPSQINTIVTALRKRGVKIPKRPLHYNQLSITYEEALKELQDMM